MLSEAQRTRLFNGLVEAIEEISWNEPLESEREPEYTSRVLAGPLLEYVQTRNHSSLILGFDGGNRPLPVVFDGQKFYPDLAIYDFGSREIAVEAKFLKQSSYSGQLTTAIGQAMIYRSFGYFAAVIVLISKEGRKVLAPATLTKLNAELEPWRVAIIQLSN